MFFVFFIADLMNDEDEPWPAIHCYVFITRSIGSVSKVALRVHVFAVFNSTFSVR